jgi:hypothetical protein
MYSEVPKLCCTIPGGTITEKGKKAKGCKVEPTADRYPAGTLGSKHDN